MYIINLFLNFKTLNSYTRVNEVHKRRENSLASTLRKVNVCNLFTLR